VVIHFSKWNGTTFSWQYEGLAAGTRYRAFIKDDFHAANGRQGSLQVHWDFSTEQSPDATRSCQVDDLSVRGGYQGGVSNGGVSGAIILANRSTSACSLGGRPKIEPTDSRGVMPVSQGQLNLGVPASPAILGPAQSGRYGFVWSNYCQATSGVMTLKVTLAVTNAQFVISPDDTTGRQQRGTPQCNDPTSPSMLSVGPFELQ
jgi:hypothetical protein